MSRKRGKRLVYSRSENEVVLPEAILLDFFSEVSPCGVIGSFLLDRIEREENRFSFKHHYITSALDSDVLAMLFEAMRTKSVVTVSNRNRKTNEPRRNRVIPLRIFISVQSGRQHLLAYQPDFNCIKSFRLDYLSNVKIEGRTPRFDELRSQLDAMRPKMWGVNTNRARHGKEGIEHIEFTIIIEENEQYIVSRLQREKRVGTVEKIEDRTYRFSADVYDAMELLPWIRTFICRIVAMSCSNRKVENQFKSDLNQMYRIYGLEEGEEL